MSPKKTPMTDAAIKELIAQGVANVLVDFEANKGSRNGHDSHDSRSGRRRTMPTNRVMGTLSISPIRDERIVGSTAKAFRQRLYKTKFLTMRSSGLVCQEEGRIIPDVHRLSGIK
nr:hypothetical protein [Tanacetum cinerariifolium]